VNSTDVQDVPSSKAVQLPESVAEQKPRETIVVMVTDDNILVQGRPVATLAEVSGNDQLLIDSLNAALTDQADRALVQKTDANGSRGEVTIMGDKSIPYRVLKRVMATVTDAGFGRVSLAVLQKSGKEG
jgi:biopolymer transport protein ExbD